MFQLIKSSHIVAMLNYSFYRLVCFIKQQIFKFQIEYDYLATSSSLVQNVFHSGHFPVMEK